MNARYSVEVAITFLQITVTLFSAFRLYRRMKGRRSPSQEFRSVDRSSSWSQVHSPEIEYSQIEIYRQADDLDGPRRKDHFMRRTRLVVTNQ